MKDTFGSDWVVTNVKKCKFSYTESKNVDESINVNNNQRNLEWYMAHLYVKINLKLEHAPLRHQLNFHSDEVPAN